MKKQRAQAYANERSKHRHRLQQCEDYDCDGDMFGRQANSSNEGGKMNSIKMLHYQRARSVADRLRQRSRLALTLRDFYNKLRTPQNVSSAVWWSPQNQKGKHHSDQKKLSSPGDLLHEEIIDFGKFARLDAWESNGRETVLRDLLDAIGSKWEHASLHTFGSFPSGLSIFSSDLDVSVQGLPGMDAFVPSLSLSQSSPKGDANIVKRASTSSEVVVGQQLQQQQQQQQQKKVSKSKNPEQVAEEVGWTIDKVGIQAQGSKRKREDDEEAINNEKEKKKGDEDEWIELDEDDNEEEDEEEGNSGDDDYVDSDSDLGKDSDNSEENWVDLDDDGDGNIGQDLELHLVSNQTKPETGATPRLDPDQRFRQVELLKHLAQQMQVMGWCAQMEVRLKARVPIIVLVHRSGLSVDISLGVSASDHTGLVARLVDTCGFQGFFPVCAFLKVFLAQRELDIPFTGGIGSFKLYCMVAYVFQMYRKRLQGQSASPNVGLGEILRGFFSYFGQQRNLNAATVLDVELAPAAEQPKTCIAEDTGEGVLQCSFDSVRKVGELQEVLATAGEVLTQALGNCNSNFPSSILSRLIDATRLAAERAEHQQRFLRYPAFNMEGRVRVAQEVVSELYRRVSFPCQLTLKEIYSCNPQLMARLLSYMTVNEALGHLYSRGGEREHKHAKHSHGSSSSSSSSREVESSRYNGYGGVVGNAMKIPTKAETTKEKRKKGQLKRAAKRQSLENGKTPKKLLKKMRSMK